ncbi:tail fiber assembly protein [Providencia sp. PAZ2]|uniref:tail fiber assembly protein n=1 Tax=Providencia lanzhouensis TaxID=3378099 RepID=UPI003D28850A
MNYFKNKNNDVYAYDDEQLMQVARLSELEQLILEKEHALENMRSELNAALNILNELKAAFNDEASREIDEDDIDAQEIHKDTLIKLESDVFNNFKAYEDINAKFVNAETEYLALKNECDSVLPAIYDVRTNVHTMKKMTEKEVKAHLNPQKSKEQHIAEAEMQKQLLADEAEKNITILERKVRLNMATEVDKSNLNAWEIYSIKIADIDTSLAPDIDWPQKP